MASYCTVDDVCSAFPQFQRQANGSISDTDIQRWIDEWKVTIRSEFLRRNFDPDTATLTQDQQAFLRLLNKNGAIADLGTALIATVTLQPGEHALAATRRDHVEFTLQEIREGVHDYLFNIGTLFGGIAGAETDPRQTPASVNQNRFFGRSQVF